MMKRKTMSILALALVLCMLLAACGQGAAKPAAEDEPASAAEQPKDDGAAGEGSAEAEPAEEAIVSARDTLTIALSSEPTNFYPNTTISNGTALNNIYNGLFRVDESYNIVPELCESYEWDDSLNLIMHLRQGVLFHNGEEFTSADAIDTLLRISQNPVLGANYSMIDFDASTCPDDYTVHLVLSTPCAALLANMCSNICYVTCASYYAEVGEEGYALKPIGTGPYKMSEWESGVFFTLERFDDYWDQEGLPYIQYIKHVFINQSANQLIELQTGNIDIATNIAITDIPIMDEDPTIDVKVDEGMAWQQIRLNPAHNEALQDVRVRLALLKALDREAITQNIYGEYAAVQNSLVAPKVIGYSDDYSTANYGYDIEAAKALLAEAGYADGFDFEFLLYQNEQATTIAEICANQWAELGVNVTITVLDMATWFSLYVAEDYDAVIAGMSNTTGDPDESLYIQFYSTQQKMFSTPELDALLDKERACTDTAEREAALNELLEYLASQVPWIPLCTTYSYYAASASLENLPNATFRALADYGQVYWVD